MRAADFQLDLPLLSAASSFAIGGLAFGATGESAVIRKIEQPQLLELLDRILDKGIVIDAWIRFSLAGVDFLTVEARIVVASIETYLEYAGSLRMVKPLAKSAPTLEIVHRNPRSRSGAG